MVIDQVCNPRKRVDVLLVNGLVKLKLGWSRKTLPVWNSLRIRFLRSG